MQALLMRHLKGERERRRERGRVGRCSSIINDILKARRRDRGKKMKDDTNYKQRKPSLECIKGQKNNRLLEKERGRKKFEIRLFEKSMVEIECLGRWIPERASQERI